VQGEISGGRYVLSELLGAGGMAEVFLAYDRILGRDLALKVLREDDAKDAAFVSRFQREAISAAALNHPHVVQVYDQGHAEDGRLYIAMEHVPGGNLKDLITRRGLLDPAEATRLGSQIAEALGAAHERGIVHRDVKPQNVLIDEAGDAKVADFGIALAASTDPTSGTNRMFGTASYMSPEQAMGERVGPESDLYSLGVVLYEMLTGTVPFAAEGPLATAMKHVTDEPIPPRKRNPYVPEALDAVVMGLLAKNPENRYGSAAELVEDLRRSLEGVPQAFAGAAGYSETVRSRAVAAVLAPANTEGGAPEFPPPGGGGRRKSIGAGLVALVALLALLGTLGLDMSRTAERGVSAVGAVRTTEGGQEGDTLGAPEGSGDTREEGSGKGSGKGTGPGIPSAVLGGGAPVPASAAAAGTASASAPSASASPVPVPASASAAATSVPASAPSASEPQASEPVASEPPAANPKGSEPELRATPFSSVPVAGGSSGSGGEDAGAVNTGDADSAAQQQYK
jgi:hypothetical protein